MQCQVGVDYQINITPTNIVVEENGTDAEEIPRHRILYLHHLEMAV